MNLHAGKITWSIALIGLFFLLQGCEDESKKPLEQGHYGPTIDVARDIKESPKQNE
jgi:hypothetical protein